MTPEQILEIIDIKLFSKLLRDAELEGARFCFETSQWLSSDGFVKSYFHIHFQHDNFPDYNSGVGSNSMNELIKKISDIIIPEIKLLGEG